MQLENSEQLVNSDSQLDEWFARIDLDAIENPSNKVAECEFFLSLASKEQDKQRFRWLISAFLGTAYSFFEMSALHAHFAFTSPDTGEQLADDEAIEILRRYVAVVKNEKRPSFIKTAGKHDICKQLYEFRRRNTHYFPLSIMSAGVQLPEDFHFGNQRGRGVPVLSFCRDSMSLIRQVQRELNE